MSKRKAIEFIIDPSSGQFSASRLLLMVLILVYLPALGVLEALGVKMGLWSHFAVIVGSVAGIYGVNTAGRVWREGYREESQGPMTPQSPPAKPAPPQGE